MSEISDRYRRLSSAFADKVSSVPPDRWEHPSPCEGWSTRDLVKHVVETQEMFQGFVGRTNGDIPSVDDDPVAAWDAARKAMQADLDDPEQAQATYEGHFGNAVWEQSVDSYLNFDLVVHGWDLARAAGLDETIPPEDLTWVAGRAEQMGDNLRLANVCGPEVEVPPDADEQTKVLGILGRKA